MVWAKPKYIVEDIDRYGNVRVYFRRRGQRKIRIHALPESPEFWEAYAAATQAIRCHLVARSRVFLRAPARERSGGLRKPISARLSFGALIQARKRCAAA
jgi:hypothetical protein